MIGLGDLVRQIREAWANITVSDAATARRLDSIEQNVNELFRKTQRPGAEWTASDEVAERKSAIGLCQIHKSLVAEGDVSTASYEPNATEIQAALRARQGLKALFRSGHLDRLEPEHRQSLSSFSFRNNGFLLAPEMSTPPITRHVAFTAKGGHRQMTTACPFWDQQRTWAPAEAGQ
jgi:hypothetical protein